MHGVIVNGDWLRQRGAIRGTAYLNENICRKCALQRKNEMARCIDCGKEKLIAVKKDGPRCSLCYHNHIAGRSLKNFLDNYRGANQRYLMQLAERVDWNEVNQDTRWRFGVFATYLHDISLPDPLTWIWLDDNMPSLRSQNRKRALAIRSCLWELAYIQVAHGKLEDRKSYLARKRIQKLVEKVPTHFKEPISNHVEWMKETNFSLYTIYTRLINTKQFLIWCDGRGVSLHEITEFVFEEFEQFYTWQWLCPDCDARAAYDVYGDSCECTQCGSVMSKTRWHTNPTIGIACANIKGLLQWAFDEGFTREKINATARHNPTFRHYSAEVMKQIIKYVASSAAHPIEAFLFYLIIFHTCSVRELIDAQLLTDENGKVLKLSETHCIMVPERKPTRGDLSTGRPEKRIEFDPTLFEWVTPLLKRVDGWRASVLNTLSNRYVLLTARGAKHDKPVTQKFITNTFKRGCANAGVGHCTAKTLRLTAGAMLTDAGVVGILELMGWSKRRAYEIGWIENRETVLPGVVKKSCKRQPPAGALAQ